MPNPPGFPGGPPPPGPPMPGTPSMGVPSTVQDTLGTFEGAQFRIDHRDSNSMIHQSI